MKKHNEKKIKRSNERWSSRIGVILAVAGSAVGIGNFLRFPGQIAEFGGGAFMLAYFVAFLLLGLPMCWAEWTVGRYAGGQGFHSIPGMITAITRRPYGKYIGAMCLVIPTVVYMYFVCVQSWCLGYAVNFLLGKIQFADADQAGAFFAQFTGIAGAGEGFVFSWNTLLPYLIICFTINFILIYRGVAKGIEWFCKYALPLLIVLAVVVLIRVLMLGAPNPEEPQASISNGLGFMWNPTKVYLEEQVQTPQGQQWTRVEELVGNTAREQAEAQATHDPKLRISTLSTLDQLKRPKLWLAAAGQIFFSLAVGFGVIATYASYLSKKDDIILSALTATSANEFTEVGLGGLITIPAGVAFLGVSSMASNTSLFSLGFNVLPLVFSTMPGGSFFGFLFFGLLFLGSVSACLSMLQPGIAFFEEALHASRKKSVSLLGALTGAGCIFAAFNSHDLKALDTLDFWAGTFLIFVMSTIFTLLFGWVLGIDTAFKEAHQGSIITIPRVYRFILKYICPLFLITVFASWLLIDVLGLGGNALDSHIIDLLGSENTAPNRIALISFALVIATGGLFSLIASRVSNYKLK